MNNTNNSFTVHNLDTYVSNFEDDIDYNFPNTKLLEEYNQMKSDYKFLKQNLNHWIYNLYPNRRKQTVYAIKQLDKIFVH